MPDDTAKRYKRLERSQKQLVYLAHIGWVAMMVAGMFLFAQAAMRLATTGPTHSQAADIAIGGLIGLGICVLGGWIVYRMLRVLSDMLDALVDAQRHASATADIVENQMLPTINQLMRLIALPDADRQRLYHEQQESSQRREIDEAYQKVQTAISRKWWVQAQRLADRFIEQFPDTDEARRLPDELASAREADREQTIDRLAEAIAEDNEAEAQTQRDALLAFGTGEPMAQALEETGKRLVRRLVRLYRGSRLEEAKVLAERILKHLPKTSASKTASEVLRRMEAHSSG